MDARRVLQLLQDDDQPPAAVPQVLGASPEAVDEARCLLAEIDEAESDAILAMPPTLARALLRAAGEAGRQDVLQEAVLHGGKEVRKEAKRVAHHLRTQGRAVELPAEAEPPPRPAPVAAEPELPVFLSVADPAGRRVLLWTRPLAGRGVELAEVVIGDEGVADLRLGDVSRRRLRELLRDLPARQVPLVPLPRDEARRLLDRIRVLVREGGRCPPEFPSWALQAVGPLPAEAPEPLRPLDAGRPPDDPAELEGLAQASASLFEEPEFLGWIPEEDLVRRIALRAEEARTSPLYLPGPQGDAQRAEAVEAVIDREVEAFFTPERRVSFADRLLEAARLLEIAGKVEPARIAAATGTRLAAGAPTDEIPFCSTYVRRVLGPLPGMEAPGPAPEAAGTAGEGPTDEEASSPLIIRP